ncbi:MAG: hypothetical protein ACREE5_06385 [Acetobacteraceae bacterium]
MTFDGAAAEADCVVDRGGVRERLDPRARAEHPGPSTFAAPTAEGPLSIAQREHARELARLPPIVPPKKAADPPADHSGRTEQGKASYYGPELPR